MKKYMKFKGNKEPCIQYELLDDTEVMEFDEVQFKAYVPHILLGVMGLVPKQLLNEATHPDNVNAIDLAINLTNKL